MAKESKKDWPSSRMGWRILSGVALHTCFQRIRLASSDRHPVRSCSKIPCVAGSLYYDSLYAAWSLLHRSLVFRRPPLQSE
ncbi:hypothetical protein Mapa_016457 [Marchantia paleacea]|nr:hypothetical protein Mapa_016457 [Marchantia paleacea]